MGVKNKWLGYRFYLSLTGCGQDNSNDKFFASKKVGEMHFAGLKKLLFF